MSDPRDYKLDIAGVTPDPAGRADPAAKPFLGVRFNCCGAYARIHKTADGTAYTGRCPRCGRPVNIAIGSGGTTARFFEAG